MSEEQISPDDVKLSKLLRRVRPGVALPPGFQNSVWRRIERPEQGPVSFAERLAGWILRPKLAAAGLAVVVLLAAGAGAVRGVRSGERQARDRYVSAVDPSYLSH